MTNLKTNLFVLLCLLNVSMQNAHPFKGHYGCWWDVHYEMDRSKSDRSSLLKNLDTELSEFISSLRDKIVPFALDYAHLPIILSQTEHGDYLLMHIDIDIVMEEEDDQPECLRALKKCDMELVMDYDSLAEYEEDYTQFISGVSKILNEACDELEQLLKHHEDILLFEANRSAIRLNIDVTLDQDMVDSIEIYMAAQQND